MNSSVHMLGDQKNFAAIIGLRDIANFSCRGSRGSAITFDKGPHHNFVIVYYLRVMSG